MTDPLTPDPRRLRSIGADRIAAERIRQFTTERYNRFHDATRAGELAAAGAAYATDDRSLWPWSEDAWKPTPADPARQLVKAGALIAAAIDSLLREEVALAQPPARADTAALDVDAFVDGLDLDALSPAINRAEVRAALRAALEATDETA